MMTLDQGGQRRAVQRVFRADTTLSDLVEFAWVDDWVAHPPAQPVWRVVADDAPHLIWHFYDETAGLADRAELVGARRTFFDVDLAHRRLTVGVRLRPGAIPALFGVPASSCTDRSLPLRDVMRSARALSGATRMCAGDVSATTFELIHDVRRSRRARGLGGIASALVPGSHRTIGDIARRAGVCERTLRAHCRRELGMNLRTVLRIRRLHTALEQKYASPGTRWSAIAAASGYADQSHFIRDCRRLLGESPSAFVARAG